MSGRVYRVSAAAQRLGVSARTIRRYIDTGKLAADRLPSGHYRVREADLLALEHGIAIPRSRDARGRFAHTDG